MSKKLRPDSHALSLVIFVPTMPLLDNVFLDTEVTDSLSNAFLLHPEVNMAN